MSGSNDRFGRRSAEEGKPHAEPVLSFKSPRGDAPRDRLDADDRMAPRLGRSAKKPGPMIEEADRPLHLSEDATSGGRGAFGWLALAAVIIVVGGVYAWHIYTPAPNAPVQGYTTPAQPGANTADTGAGNPAQALGAAGQVTTPTAIPPAATPANEPAAQSVATAPTPKSLPSTPPEPPRKTISDAAALNPLTTKTPPSAATPALSALTHDVTKPAATKPETHAETPRPETPRKAASLELPKSPPSASAEPPMPTLPAPAPPAATATVPAAPSTPVPQSFSGPTATGRPQPLTGAPAPANQNATQNTATAAPTPSLAPLLHPPAAAAGAPVPGTNSVTVNGVTYVNGEQPQALGTLATPSPDATNAPTPLTPPATTAPSAPAATPYIPQGNSAPLPNDVIIGPNGQMSVPANSQ